ncbi:MAG: hypothetical protein ACR2NA_11270 [Solirubrobacterales bacterium]
MSSSFPFVQFEFPGRLGPPDGRYLLRTPSRDEERTEHPTVLVLKTYGVASPSRFRRRRRGSGPPEAEQIPLTRATVVDADPLAGDEAAQEWIARAERSDELRDTLVTTALAHLNRLLHGQRAAAADPRVHDVVEEQATAIRLGFGTGDEVADGRWTEAGQAQKRRQRPSTDDLRPQERLAAFLKGAEEVDPCETLVLRCRADLDAGRVREAALQLRVALESLLADLAGQERAHEDQARDLRELTAFRAAVGDAANQALRGDLSGDQAEQVTMVLEVGERALRRRRLLGL